MILPDFKLALQLYVLRRRAYHDRERAGLNDKMVVAIPKTEVLRCQREVDFPLFARLKMYALKATKHFLVGCHGTDVVAQIELHNFVTFPFANVFYLARQLYFAFYADDGRFYL